MQKDGELPSGVFGQGIISPAEAPVVHQGPLTEGVDLHHVVDAAALGQLSRRLALGDDAAEQAVIDALMIQQMDSKYMYTFKSGRIMFESIEEIPWTLDGEFGGEHDEVVIENLNKELQIMVPGTHEEE